MYQTALLFPYATLNIKFQIWDKNKETDKMIFQNGEKKNRKLKLCGTESNEENEGLRIWERQSDG